jgi:hypothetical protein
MANERHGRYLGDRYSMSLFGKKDGKTEHHWVEESLSAYLDGELSSQEREAVEHHLARCQDCRWNLKTLRQTVRWTKDLPTVPIPRVFTIPAPAQPARARQRSWSLGLLQGATALVALLLVFVVAGDFMLSGVMPASMPQPQIMKEQVVMETAAVQVEITREVELQAAAPAAPEAEVVVEEAAVAEATSSPEPRGMAVTEPPPAEPSATVVPTPTPEASGMAVPGFETPAEKAADRSTGEQATGLPTEGIPPGMGGGPTEVPLAVASPLTLTQAYSVEDTVEPPAIAPLPTVAPEPAVGAQPTIVADVRQYTVPGEEDQSEARGGGTVRQPLLTGYQIAEVALGMIFILLATATVVVMIRRYRAR